MLEASKAVHNDGRRIRRVGQVRDGEQRGEDRVPIPEGKNFHNQIVTN
jgi:hypothetical protein